MKSDDLFVTNIIGTAGKSKIIVSVDGSSLPINVTEEEIINIHMKAGYAVQMINVRECI